MKERFILTGVDKAPNNISFICKQFYLQNIRDELDNTSTYVLVNDDEEDIIKKHIRFCSKFNISVKDRVLPFIHLFPKFHKKKLDYRYIAAGKISSTKLLSKIFTAILKLTDRTLKFSDNFQFNFKNASGYWIAKNKDAAVSNLNYLNHSRHANSIGSFDFKKLYTNLPHDKLIEKISELIKRCFDEKKLSYINVSDNLVARWSSKKQGKWSFSYDDIIELFKFLINNIFIKFQGRIHRQVIGIPMGLDCAPQVADLLLYWYEHNFVPLGVKNNKSVVHALKFASRYIDDLNIPNCTKELSDIVCNDIYPSELDIIKTNENPKSSTFLDLDIFVSNGQFSTKLYDKRRDFKFNVVSFPNLRSNIPKNPTYGVFIGELHRLCKSSSLLDDFVCEVKLLINKLVNQKFSRVLLYRKLTSFLNNEPACLHKYWSKLSVNMFL